MNPSYDEIVSKGQKVVNIQIADSPLLAGIVCATAGLSGEQIERLILGQLSPACLPRSTDQLPYPDVFGAEEMIRADNLREYSCPDQLSDGVPLDKLLESRIGTAASYAVVLAIALTANGHSCELAITGPSANPPNYPFVISGDRQIDLFADACGNRHQELRAHKRAQL